MNQRIEPDDSLDTADSAAEPDSYGPDPDQLYVVLGAGPVGLAVLDALAQRGQRIRLVSRSGRGQLPPRTDVIAADMSEAAAARSACSGATAVLACVGGDYSNWARRWPALMTGMLQGAESAGARFVFADNLYMYGPQEEPLREDMPYTSYGVKPAVRAAISRLWEQAHNEGRVLAAAVRASDFYGPRVRNALLGSMVFGAMMNNRSATLFGRPEMPHSFTYVPDFARALITIADAPDDAYGQAWHVPSAAALPVREVVELACRLAGIPPRISVMSELMVKLGSLFNADAREMREMMYQWTAPFVLDHSRFAARFWSDYTPLEQGLKATLDWYRRASG